MAPFLDNSKLAMHGEFRSDRGSKWAGLYASLSKPLFIVRSGHKERQGMRPNHRRKVLFVTGIAAVLLGTSSAAFACTTWVGKMTVTGNRSPFNGPSVTVQGGNVAGLMTYCAFGGEPAGKASIDHPSGSTESIKIDLAPATYCNGPVGSDPFNPLAGTGTGTSNVFPPGTYHVTYMSTGFEYTNVADNPLSRQYTRDCMKVVSNGSTVIGPNSAAKDLQVGGSTITVASNNTASQTYTSLNTAMAKNLWDEDAPFTTDESAVCVSGIQSFNGRTTQFGLQAPFFVF